MIKVNVDDGNEWAIAEVQHVGHHEVALIAGAKKAENESIRVINAKEHRLFFVDDLVAAVTTDKGTKSNGQSVICYKEVK